MSGHIRKNDEREELTLGMIFMAFLMAIAALNGIWFLAVIIKMQTIMLS